MVESYSKYVAFDPGINTGVACFSATGNPVFLETLRGHGKLWEFLDRLELQQPKPTTIIYERYRVGYGPNNYHQAKYAKIHAGQTVPTEQAIGAILRTARKVGCAVIPQEPSILPMALLHAGIKKPKWHLPDHESAFAHGHEYLLRQGIIKPRVLNEIRKKTNSTESDR